MIEDVARLASLADAACSRALPCALVDVAAFDRNLATIARLANGKPIRVASKSLRVPTLISRALAHPSCRGIMAYHPREAAALVDDDTVIGARPGETAFDDVLVAYPSLDASALAELRRVHAKGARVSLVVDSRAGVDALARAMDGVSRPFPAVVELDMSLRPATARGRVHLGVRRSPVRSIDDVIQLVEHIRAHPMLSFGGLMGYEAQVAGLPDDEPGGGLLNVAKRAIRRRSIEDARRRRGALVDALRARNIEIPVFNGGGSGSLDSSSSEPWLTEVAAGSALYAPRVFDHYTNVKFEPAAFFALPVVRSSDEGFVTCYGGGYIASGAPGWGKVPEPVWPPGLSLVDTEGAGEVQTPLKVKPGMTRPALGSVVLFRHAKAGELFERFDSALLVDNGKIVDEAKSYRGRGWSFG